MILKNKNAVIYGAGGSLGGAIAKAFAKEGSRVFLSGRSLPSVEKVANEILASGGKAEVDQVDAMNEQEIDLYIQRVISKAGTVDISFNAIDYKAIQDVPLVDMAVSDFVNPVTIAIQSQFLTSTAAARIMMRQRSGVILSLTATPGGIGYPFTGGFGVACCAIESFSTALASEIGIYGVRAVNIRSGGSPDSNVFKQAIEAQPEEMKGVLQRLKGDTMLKELPSMADIANVAVFLSSELAGKITGVTIDVTAGTTAGMGHLVPPLAM